ncbi:MAG: hypothetical protein AAF215_20440 [Cyanobacteria bacterium P01_A01_bin.123]
MAVYLELSLSDAHISDRTSTHPDETETPGFLKNPGVCYLSAI